MISLILLLVSTVTAGCSDLLAPECPNCIVCSDYSSNWVLAVNNPNISVIPPRVINITNITKIFIMSPVIEIPSVIGTMTSVTIFRITTPLNNARIPSFTAPIDIQILSEGVLTSYDDIYKQRNLRGITLRILTGAPTFQFSRLSSTGRLKTIYIDCVPINESIPDLRLYPSLSNLILRYNSLSGTLPITPPNVSSFYMRITNNLLTGTVPNYSSSTVQQLYLNNNQLSGTIPIGISTIPISNLAYNSFTAINWPINSASTYLNVAYNYLNGTTPYSRYLTYLDISYNRYDTILPIYTNLTARRGGLYLNIAGNRFNEYAVETGVIMPTTVVSFPQDVDECDLGTHSCSVDADCVDGWWPRMSYTCKCHDGYRQIGNECIDIDECVEGNNCEYHYQCINTVGSYNCCTTGYAAVNGVCRDINECLPNAYNLNDDCGRVDACVNNLGGYTCCPLDTYNSDATVLNATCLPCVANYTLVTTQETPFAVLASYTGFAHQHCVGTCDNGQRIKTAPLVSRGCSNPLVVTEACGWPCIDSAGITDPKAVVRLLVQELSRDGFLSDVVRVLGGTNVSIRGLYANNSATLVIEGLDADVVSIVTNLSLTITPAVSNYTILYANNTLTLTAYDSAAVYTTLTPIIIAVCVGVGVLLAAIIAGVWYYRSFDYGLLPEAVTWSYRLANSWTSAPWTYRGTNENGYYYRSIPVTSAEYSRILRLVSFGKYMISDITLVANLTLLRNFVGQYNIMTERLERYRDIFAKKRWSQNSESCKATYQHYADLVARYEWCQDRIPIIPVCHGTDRTIAEKICETGFANLSTTDAGWYGKGIYFTSYTDYCLPYIASQRNPVIIIAWVIPGNIYPVVDRTLNGAPGKSGYQSHYVRTNAKGDVASAEEARVFNEIVITQEAQILPCAIVSIAPSSLDAMGREWQQSIT